jgi:hypothetical protein
MMRRTATIVRMTPVAVLLLAPTPLISYRLPMGTRYPRDLWMAMIQITRPSRRGSCELLATSMLGALLEHFSDSFGRCFLIEFRQEVPKLLRGELPHPL